MVEAPVAPPVQPMDSEPVPSSQSHAPEARPESDSTAAAVEVSVPPCVAALQAPYIEGGFEDAVRRALGMLGESSGLGQLGDAEVPVEDSLQVGGEEETTPPAQAAVAVDRSSLPRRRRIELGSDAEEEEPVSSDEEWWGSDDEYLQDAGTSPGEVSGVEGGQLDEEEAQGGDGVVVGTAGALDGGARWREGGSVWEQQTTVETAGMSGLSLKRPPIT